MKRKYAAIFMLILYVVVMVLSLAACGDDSGEWKSYHKVYRGNDGLWRGTDVLYYDEGSSTGEIILVITGNNSSFGYHNKKSAEGWLQ